MSASRAIGLSAISGLRCFSGPAFVGRAASHGHLHLDGTPLGFLNSPRLSKALMLMVLGELAGDKLPMTPSRTGLPPLLDRAVSGGLVGAALFASEGRRIPVGAILGATSAVTAAFAGERLRAAVVERTGLPDPVVAVAEDAAVLAIGSHSLRRAR